MTEFGRLNPDGSYEHTKTVNQSDLRRCRFVILIPEHYRDDGSCRCDDPEHTEMHEWGYRWDGRRWT